MIRVFLADSQPQVRSALRLLLQDLNMLVVGETADWFSALAQAPDTYPHMLLIGWDLITLVPGATLAQLRWACINPVIIVLISHMESRQQAALSVGADAFISRGEMPDRVAEHLRAAAACVRA